jgi:hypothetical protein
VENVVDNPEVAIWRCADPHFLPPCTHSGDIEKNRALHRSSALTFTRSQLGSLTSTVERDSNNKQ